MFDQIRATRRTKLQTVKPKYADNLEGSVSIAKVGDMYHIIKRAGGHIYKTRSMTMDRANKYAREMI